MELISIYAYLFMLLFSCCDCTIEVRLKPPANQPHAIHKGTVEVRFNSTSQWGSICDDSWDLRDASVVCEMLGFDSATSAHVQAEFGLGTGPVWLDDVECLGIETTLFDCPRNPSWGNNNCAVDHSEDAGVTCFQAATAPPPEPTTVSNCNARNDMRIRDGANQAVGRVEVRINGRWGTVCDDGFDENAAKVVCGGLCYGTRYAKALSDGGNNVPGTLDILLDEVKCLGTEPSLVNCPANRTAHDCTHKEDVMVSCVNYNEGDPSVPTPEVLCHDTTMDIAFERVSHPSLQSIHLSLRPLPAGCDVQNATNATHITLSASYSECAAVRESNDTHIVYSTTLWYNMTTIGVITRRTPVFRIPIYCAIPRIGDANKPFDTITQTAPPQIGVGNFNVVMQIFTDDSFRSPVVTYPFSVTLGAWLNVAVTLRTEDPRLKQVVHDCWATPNENSTSTPQHSLIANKCAADSTLQIFPYNDTMLQFRLQSFDFIGNYTVVYIHCEVFVCKDDDNKTLCDQSCVSRKRRSAEISDNVGDAPSVNELRQGPIYFIKQGAEQAALNAWQEKMVAEEMLHAEEMPHASLESGSSPRAWLRYPMYICIIISAVVRNGGFA